MGKTSIEWTDKVWNPVTGCTKVSAGCKNCWAERVFPRIYGRDRVPVNDAACITNRDPDPANNEHFRSRRFTDVRCHPERLEQPLHWRKPCRIFVNSMSDLFHESVHRDFILRVWHVMQRCPNHTFQILTKRPWRMKQLIQEWLPAALPLAYFHDIQESPPPNVWLGVSVENQKTADERIPLLLQTPASVRFVSVEPLLGPVDFTDKLGQWADCPEHGRIRRVDEDGCCLGCGADSMHYGLDWVLCGGESGPKARPMEEAWARSVMLQCKSAGVPFFMKQGSKANWSDFKNFESFPKDLQVREFPNAI